MGEFISLISNIYSIIKGNIHLQTNVKMYLIALIVNVSVEIRKSHYYLMIVVIPGGKIYGKVI